MAWPICPERASTSPSRIAVSARRMSSMAESKSSTTNSMGEAPCIALSWYCRRASSVVFIRLSTVVGFCVGQAAQLRRDLLHERRILLQQRIEAAVLARQLRLHRRHAHFEVVDLPGQRLAGLLQPDDVSGYRAQRRVGDLQHLLAGQLPPAGGGLEKPFHVGIVVAQRVAE